MTDKKAFGSFIRTKRTEKNYSQKDLAEMLFVTEGAVSKWERGVSYPDITLISDICRALDITEHELITASIDNNTRKIRHEAHKFRIIRNTWFLVPTISYSIALLVCFICNLAVNHTLSWFFIVLSSLLCGYSFIPTFTLFFNSKKLLVFTSSSYTSICILLLTCAIYTNNLSWLLTACIGVLMGYVLIFIPILLSKTKYSRYKFIISFMIIFILTILMLVNINLWNSFMLGNAIILVIYCFTPVIMSTLICLSKIHSLIKASICIIISGISLYYTNYVISFLFNIPIDNDYLVNFSNWGK